jgi:hypothetical protein
MRKERKKDIRMDKKDGKEMTEKHPGIENK